MAELQASLGPTHGSVRLDRFLVRRIGKTTLVVACEDERRYVVRVPRSTMAMDRGRQNFAALQAIHSTPLISDEIKAIVPQPRLAGIIDRYSFYAEDSVPGTARDDYREWPSTTGWEPGALRFISEMHLNTRQPVYIDRKAFDRDFGAPLWHIRRRCSTLKSNTVFEKLGAILERTLVGETMPFVWSHGDFSAGNCLYDAARRLSAVVDWELFSDYHLPLLDVLHCMEIPGERNSSATWQRFDTIRTLFQADRLLEMPVLASYVEQMGIPQRVLPALILMYWVDHVAKRIDGRAGDRCVDGEKSAPTIVDLWLDRAYMSGESHSGTEPERGYSAAGYSKAAKIGAVWSFAQKAVSQSSDLLASIALSRLLTPTDFGIAAATGFFLRFANKIANFGLGGALLRLKEMRPEHVSSVFVVNLIVGIASWLCLTLSASSLASFFRAPEVAPALRVAALVYIVLPFGTGQVATISREMRFRHAAIIEWAYSAVFLLTAVPLAWRGFGFWSLIYAQLAANVVQALTKVYLGGRQPRLKFSSQALRETIPFGAGLYAKRLLTFAAEYLDSLIVGRLLGMASLGLYDKAFNTVGRVSERLNAPIVFLRIFTLIQGDANRLRRAYLKACVAATFIGFPTFAALIVIAPQLVEVLYGRQWLPAVVPFQILCIAGACRVTLAYASAAIQAAGQIWSETWRQATYVILIAVGVSALRDLGHYGRCSRGRVGNLLHDDPHAGTRLPRDGASMGRAHASAGSRTGWCGGYCSIAARDGVSHAAYHSDRPSVAPAARAIRDREFDDGGVHPIRTVWIDS